MIAIPFFLTILVLVGAAIFLSLLLARRPGAIGVLILIAIGVAFFGYLGVEIRTPHLVTSPPVVIRESVTAIPAPPAPPAPEAAPAPAANGIQTVTAVDTSGVVLPAEKPEAPADLAQQKPTASTPVAASAVASSSVKKGRPAWVDQLPAMEHGVYQQNIASGPYTTRAECDAAFHADFRRAVAAYADNWIGQGAGRRIAWPLDELRPQIVREQWEEHRQHSVGEMVWLHSHLAFDDHVRTRMQYDYREAVTRDRTAYTASGGAILLGLLATVFGYLKIDTATRGYYTRRLQLAASILILSLAVGAGGLVFKARHWPTSRVAEPAVVSFQHLPI